ncbi:MAG: DUF1838 domain-containing protein [Rhodospirillaceae bacterium]|nr:DUF1838 domain-containing protein [Rhodospirillaceae bacterium]
MNHSDLTRRMTMYAGLGVASAFAAGPEAARAATSLKLDDPKERAKIRAKIVASAADEAVPAFYRLHIFAYMHDKNLVPLYTMNNVAIKVCKPMANGNTMITNYEAGVYCKFDTHEVLEIWNNPITGETLEPWHFIGRPLSVEIGPDDVITGPGATLKPKPMAIETVGDTVIMPTMSGFSYPNPFQPSEFPEDSSGPIMYWDSHYVYFAPLKEVADPSVLRASASIQFQNLVSFQPWAGMGTRPGRSWGRALGAKMKNLDEIPAAARKGLEQKVPMLFDLANWPKDRDDAAEFKKVLKKKRGKP